MGNSLNSLIFRVPKSNLTVEEAKKKGKLFKLKTITNETIYALLIFPQIRDNLNKYIVFSYGNGSDMSQFLDYGQKIADNTGAVFVLYDYLGYGLSSGSPGEKECYESLNTVLDLLIYKLGIDTEDIILAGHSLGTGVVVEKVYRDIFWSSPILLISPMKSISEVVKDFTRFGYLMTFADKFVSYQKIADVTCPVKIIHGLSDRTVDVSHGITLYNSLKNKKFNPTWVVGIGHNDIFSYVNFHELLK